MEKIPGKHEKSPSSLAELASFIENYNDEFSLGRSIGRMILGAIPEETEHDLDDQKVEEKLTLDEMRENAKDILESTGLDLVPADASWFIAGGDENHQGRELRIDIKDGAKFVAYLQSLDATSKEEVRALEKIISSLTTQFQREYDLTSADDTRFLELMGSLSDVLEECDRLGTQNDGLSKAIEPFKKYLEVARAGYLREYRMAEKLLLHKPFEKGHFTLEWHTDASAESLESYWNTALDTLQKISLNERAVDLYNQAKKTIFDALENGEKEVGEWMEKDDKNLERHKEFMGVFAKIRARLQEF